MTRTRRWRRRTSVLAIAGVTLATGTTLALAAPGAAPGSGFGSVNIAAVASAVRSPLFSNGGEDVEAEAPYAEADLNAGPSGRATTSVFWPGVTGANGGSTLYTATNGCIAGPVCLPQSDFNALNDPEKATAQSGVGKPEQTNDQDGITQKAVAKPALVSATTTISASKVPAVSESFGTTTASSVVKLTSAKTAVISASSSLHDIALAGGVVKISSLSSIAKASTNTVKGVGTASTTVTGATVAGIPVAIDSNGVHVKGSGPKLSSLTDQVNKALSKSGVSIYVAQPTKMIKGSDVTVDAGALVVLFRQSQYVAQVNDTGTLLTLGGASITASTSPGFPTPTVPPVKTPPTKTHSGGGVPPTTSGGGSGAGGGGLSVPSSTGTVNSGGAPPAVAPTTTSPQLAASSVSLLSGYGAVWLVFGLLLATGLAFGLRRLPDEVLESPAVVCLLED